MLQYKCPKCAGTLEFESNSGNVKCPYCGNSTIMMGNLKGDLKPELIIPFKLKKEDAMAGFKSHMEGKKFLPKAFVDAHHLEEVKGIYVPFWLFDSTSLASLSISFW